MTEQPADAIGSSEDESSEPTGQEPETFTREYVENLRKENAKHRTAVRTAEKARLDAMSGADRAVAEAELRGRTAASMEYGKRLARTAFDAAAARRNADFDVASAFEYLDLSRFVGDDGEPDSKAIKAAVENLVPAKPGKTASFDGGSRTPAKPTGDMNQLIRQAAGLG